MAKIFVSMSGEGRGHATRMKAVTDLLRDRHEISIFAPGDAYDLLAPAYRDSAVSVRRIPGLRFYYNDSGRLKYSRTATQGAAYLLRLNQLIAEQEAVIREEKPDLVIVDFEMSLPRAARRCGVPFVSLNHQHFLVVNDLSALPGQLRRHAAYMGFIVRSYYSGQALTIVSSFYFPPLKPEYEDRVVQVGVILRPRVLEAPVTREGHFVAYLRRFAPPSVLEALKSVGAPVRVYGLGEREADANLEFKPICEERFVADLASSEALICTAGNQLVGEALFLRKPVLAMPESKNYEQYINAHYLAEEGVGEWVELDRLDAESLRGFTGRLDEYRAKIDPERYNGNPRSIAAIEEILATLTPEETAPRKALTT